MVLRRMGGGHRGIKNESTQERSGDALGNGMTRLASPRVFIHMAREPPLIIE